jgi:hypothetical protein
VRHLKLFCAPCEWVRASQLVKRRRRFIDWVIEIDTVRDWRVLRSFRDIDQCRAFLVALPQGITSSSSPPDPPNRGIVRPTAIPDAAGRGVARNQRSSLLAMSDARDPASCARAPCGRRGSFHQSTDDGGGCYSDFTGA